MTAQEAEAKVTTKGQITIPKEVRVQLALQPGDKLRFLPDNGGYRIQKRISENPFEKWRGYLKHLKGKRTDDLIDEMRGR